MRLVQCEKPWTKDSVQEAPWVVSHTDEEKLDTKLVTQRTNIYEAVISRGCPRFAMYIVQVRN